MKRLRKIVGLKLDRYTQSAIFCLVIILLIGLLSNIIATSKPLYLKHGSRTYFPAFSNRFEKDMVAQYPYGIDWQHLHFESAIYAPVPYKAGEADLTNGLYRPPFAKNKDTQLKPVFRHWLGTNLKGEDLLSGLIHGTTVSLKIGFFSILIAVIIGTFLGLMAGYFQNDSLKIPVLSFVFILLSVIPSFYFADLISFFATEYSGWKDTTLIVMMVSIYLCTFFVHVYLSYLVGKWIQQLFRWKNKIHLPLDTILSRIIEIFAAIPKLMLVVALAAMLERSVTNMILIIGIAAWPGIARLVRAETMKVRNQDFITSAKALGLRNRKIIMKHVLPNIMGPIIVSFVFGLSAAILIESGLSFLNIGVPENVITWGQLLSDGQKNFNAWWMVVFPGLAIFITVLCLNIIGEKFKSLLDPVNRSLT